MSSGYIEGHFTIDDGAGEVTVVYSVGPGNVQESERLLGTPFPDHDKGILQTALPALRQHYGTVEGIGLVYPFHEQGNTSSKDTVPHISICLLSNADLTYIKTTAEDQLAKLKKSQTCHVYQAGALAFFSKGDLFVKQVQGLHRALNQG